ncbi:hypothetical protein B0H13DRAFT_2050000 [Mycena leptocephala]|nr:hypothetical protein B0H13DRAFT_2050000 [Mycena leptocephala]
MDSPFQTVLHTNTILSDAECERIRAFLVDPREEVEILTREITQLKRLLTEAIRKRDELTTFIDAHLALISPVRRLPDDVVQEIFVACMPSEHNAPITAEEAPLVLCQICSSWRTLAFSTPQLWASLHIVVPKQSRIQALVETVNACLSRSGVLPLSISLAVSKTWRDEEESSEEEEPFEAVKGVSLLLASLVSLSSRWSNILIPRHFPADPFTHLSAKDVPMLQTVLVGNPLNRRTHNNLSFLAGPSLRSVSFAVGGRFPNLPLRWEQLTHLSIHGSGDGSWGFTQFTTHDALSILRRCPMLQTCQFDIAPPRGLDGIPVPTALPQLSHFDLRPITLGVGIRSTSFHPSATDELFTKLVFPSLHSLKYRHMSIGDPLPTRMFLPSIERLSLHAEVSSSDLIQALQLMPLLGDLELSVEPILSSDDRSVADSNFLAHFLPGTAPVLCPQITRLQLHNFSALTDDTLLEFIIARRRADDQNIAQLVSMVAVLDRGRQWDIIVALQPLIADGLDLELEYRYDDPTYSPREGMDGFDVED